MQGEIHGLSYGNLVKIPFELYPQNTSLNVNSEEVTPGCWPSRQSCKEKPYLRLANKNKKLRWTKEHVDTGQRNLPRRPASQSRLFTVDVETGVLRVLFNEAAS